jgi:hypothetical protein
MTISASAKKEIAQDPMGRCARTRVKSAEVASDGCYWAANDLREGLNGKSTLSLGSKCNYSSLKSTCDGRERLYMGNVG